MDSDKPENQIPRVKKRPMSTRTKKPPTPKVTIEKLFKLPPVLRNLAHIPFDQMEYDLSVTKQDVDIKRLEQDLTNVLLKHGIIPNNEDEVSPTSKGKRVAIVFPPQSGGSLQVDLHHTLPDGRREWGLLSITGNKVTRSRLIHDASFSNVAEYPDVRRVFTIATNYNPERLRPPAEVEEERCRIVMENTIPTIIRSYMQDEQEVVFYKGALPAEKYQLLNKHLDLPEEEPKTP